MLPLRSNQHIIENVFAAEARRLKEDHEVGDPGRAHALNLQLMVFRLRLSTDLAFYAKVWQRICKDERLWAQVEVLVKDAHRDWKARRPDAKQEPESREPRRQERRIREDYPAPYYQPPAAVPEDGRRRERRTVFDIPDPELPEGTGQVPVPLPSPEESHRFWTLIQLVKETFEATRRVTEFWARAANRRVTPGDQLIPPDPDEDAFLLEFGEALISRVLPNRWFLSKTPQQRDALLAQATRLRVPVDAYEDLAASWRRHPDPDRDLPNIIDEAARSLIDAGGPKEALGLLDAYLPHLQSKGRIVPMLYHDLFLAHKDLGNPRKALRAANQFQQAAEDAGDEDQLFLARLCQFELHVRFAGNPRDRVDQLLPTLLDMARRADEPHLRVWRLVQVSVECDRAGVRRHAESALTEAQSEAAGDADLVQYVLEHDRLRDRQGGRAHTTAPPRQAVLFGTRGGGILRFDDLVESYYAYYPDERPTLDGTAGEGPGAAMG